MMILKKWMRDAMPDVIFVVWCRRWSWLLMLCFSTREGFLVSIFQIKEWGSSLCYFLIPWLFWFCWIQLLLITMYPYLECFSQISLILSLFILFLLFSLMVFVFFESLLYKAFQEIGIEILFGNLILLPILDMTLRWTFWLLINSFKELWPSYSVIDATMYSLSVILFIL